MTMIKSQGKILLKALLSDMSPWYKSEPAIASYCAVASHECMGSMGYTFAFIEPQWHDIGGMQEVA
jgi:hypothetical protein